MSTRQSLHRALSIMVILSCALLVNSSVGVAAPPLIPDSVSCWLNIFPFGLKIYGLWPDVTDPNRLYATTHAGLYSTSDGGASWKRMWWSGELDWTTFAQSPISPNMMYYAWSKGGRGATLLSSTDHGRTWGETGKDLITKWVSFITFDPLDAQIVYVSTGQSIFKTLNGGATWGEVTPQALRSKTNTIGPPYSFLSVDPFNTDHLLAGGTSGGDTGRRQTNLCESVDGGLSWGIKYFAESSAEVEPNRPNWYNALIWDYLEFDPRSEGRLVGWKGETFASSLYLSHDQSSLQDISLVAYKKNSRTGNNEPENRHISWIWLPDDSLARTYYVACSSPENTRARSEIDRGVYMTSDRGSTWREFFHGAASAVVEALSGHLYVATSGGILRSEDKGSSWKLASFGIPLKNWGGSLVRDDDLRRAYMLGYEAGSAILCSVDTVRGEIYIGKRGGFYSSPDRGHSWDWHPVPNGGNVRQVVPTIDSALYVAVGSSGAFGTGGAELWKKTPSGDFVEVRTGRSPRLVGLSHNHPNVIYLTAREKNDASGDQGGNVLLKSEDAGLTWQSLDLHRWFAPGLAEFKISGIPHLVVHPRAPASVIAVARLWKPYATDNPFAVLVSGDGGTTWTDIVPSIQRARGNQGSATVRATEPTSVQFDPVESSTIYVAFEDDIMRSSDAGTTWKRLPTISFEKFVVGSGPSGVKYEDAKIRHIAVSPVSPDVLYVATSLGVWRTENAGQTWSRWGRSNFLSEEVSVVVVTPYTVLAEGPSGIYRLTSPCATRITD